MDNGISYHNVFYILFAAFFFASIHVRQSALLISPRKKAPGPHGLPILGNIHQIPGQHLATYFRSLLRKYGGLVSLNLAGTPILLIGDMKAAKDILEKQAAIFSSRPKVPYVHKYVDASQVYWGIHDQTPSFHIGRKLTAGIMAGVRAGKTEPLQQFEALLTVQHLLNDQGNKWFQHMERFSASTALTASFGAHCPNIDTAELKEAMFSVSEFVRLCTPSASIINVFPFLDWIPGPMPWRARARKYRRREDAFYASLIREALYGRAAGMNTWAAIFAKQDKPEGDQSRLMNQFTGAAIETTALALQTLILASIKYPSWVKDAQMELDKVVGRDRLPTFADRPFLPYIEAVVREMLRWRPAARFGVPHESMSDTTVKYNGEEYFVPAGTTVFAVAWAIDHDPQRYNDPDRFDPARFLNESLDGLRKDYETSAFGFGRRVCPGIPFAERSLFIAAALLLWTFDICPAPDPPDGRSFAYDASDAAFYGDFSNAARPFPATFIPRTDQHAIIARHEWEECEKDLNLILPAPKT